MELPRRTILAGGLGLASGLAPDASRAPILIGYGVVNLWHAIDANRLADRLRVAGCTLTEIEYVAWFDYRGREGKAIETRPEAAKRFVESMRRRGITTLISVVNWNSAAQRAQPDSWFSDRVNEIGRMIGPNRVILLPVSEPDGQEGGKAYRWTEYAAKHWKGLRAGNGDGGRGDPRIPGFDYVDWHHCEDFDGSRIRLSTASKPTINNTDCGPVLNPGPDRARRMARIALDRGAHFLVYGWEDDHIDETVISALGDEIRSWNERTGRRSTT